MDASCGQPQPDPACRARRPWATPPAPPLLERPQPLENPTRPNNSMMTGTGPRVGPHTLRAKPHEALEVAIAELKALILGKSREVVAELLPDDMRPGVVHSSLQWESVMCVSVIGFLVKQQFFGTSSSVKKEYLNAKSYLEDSSLEKESSKIQRLADTYGKLKRTNSISKEEMTSLVKEGTRGKKKFMQHHGGGDGCLFLIHQRKKPGGFSLGLDSAAWAAALRQLLFVYRRDVPTIRQ
ncbi:hypothetical protein Celaphus_00011643 [Cervus elaphus hippelaphus]|uniref:Uncharacterized protein n=1 Tax=Cervus elaphus hippelaphus TaxID=46360 RepID=A0A212DEH9_CEREH|nr:hypothetical protein Celaphus_00011643 [Cervus elaphus hippelaphus]